jgi:hypothetical protein
MHFMCNGETGERQQDAMWLLVECDAGKLRKSQHLALMHDPAKHKAVWTASCQKGGRLLQKCRQICERTEGKESC